MEQLDKSVFCFPPGADSFLEVLTLVGKDCARQVADTSEKGSQLHLGRFSEM